MTHGKTEADETARTSEAAPATQPADTAYYDADIAGARRSRRGRKLFGTLVIPLFLLVYMLVAMNIGAIFINGNGFLLELAFYLVAGLAWIPPVVVVIRWMEVPKTLPGEDGQATSS